MGYVSSEITDEYVYKHLDTSLREMVNIVLVLKVKNYAAYFRGQTTTDELLLASSE